MRIENAISQWVCRVPLVVLALPVAVYSARWPANSESQGAETPVQEVTPEAVLAHISELTEKIKSVSFPELKQMEVQVKLLQSNSDFFRTRFGLPQFFFSKKMRYLVKVNPKVVPFQAPEEGLEAIIAHELSHVVYYAQGNRLRLFGLTRLVSKDFTVCFERRTDLQAISRGYGERLKTYRQWLYQNVPPDKLEEKRRNYFSPAEIDAILSRIQSRPELLEHWLKNIPRSLKEIEKPQ